MIVNESNIVLGKTKSHAVHHEAKGKQFVVIAPPLYEEGVRLRKVLVNASRYLCARGYDVVRFDYFGTGFSPGDDTDLRLPQAKEDLKQAIEYCHNLGAERITILGVRFGAYLGLLSRIENTHVNDVIAWEPIMDPKRYLKELIRSEASSQMFIYGKVKSDQDQLFQQMAAEGYLFIEGYGMSKEFSEQLNAAPDIDKGILSRYKKSTELIYWQSSREFKHWSGNGVNCQWLTGIRIAYSHIRYLNPVPQKLFDATLMGIEANG